MQRLFQDSMAIVRHFERPTLFIIVTINPNWIEIKNELRNFPGQIASDRPDIVARVFRMKMISILDDIKKRNVFGKCLDRVWTIEYQKRGLPHMHLLLFLEDQFLDSETIDEIVCAELPDPLLDTNNVLRNIIEKQMTHESCEFAKPNAMCMLRDEEKNQCSKKFPKAFQNRTIVEENGYSLYRRRNDGRI